MRLVLLLAVLLAGCETKTNQVRKAGLAILNECPKESAVSFSATIGTYNSVTITCEDADRDRLRKDLEGME